MKNITKKSDIRPNLINLKLLMGLTVLLTLLSFSQEKVFSQVEPIEDIKKINQPILGSAEELFNQGREYQIRGKLLEAENTFKEVLLIQPEHAQTHVQLGMIYKKQERYRDAVDELKKAVTIQPNSITHKNLGILYTKLGENKKAVKEFEAAIELNPNLENIHYLLAKVLFKNKIGNHRRVIKEFKEALKNDPQLWEASFSLGLVYKSQKLYKDAIPYFEEVVGMQPSYADAFYQLGHMYIAVKEGKAAITHLLKAEKLYQKDGNQQKVSLSKKYLKKLFKKYGFKRSDFI